jgi:hypothetical protein
MEGSPNPSLSIVSDTVPFKCTSGRDAILQLTMRLQGWTLRVLGCSAHHAEWPPSMRRSEPRASQYHPRTLAMRCLPVIKLLASLIRNAAAPLYSWGLLSRPSIFCLGHSVFRSGNVVKRSSTMAVTMYPGEMVLTRMSNSPHSLARLRPSWSTAALDAL